MSTDRLAGTAVRPLAGGRKRDTVLAALEAFRAVDPGLTVNNIISFLYVAENEGLNITELAHVAGLNHATASRTVRSLACQTDDGALSPYVGLITLDADGASGISRILKLSAAGHALRGRLDRLIEAAVPITTPAATPAERAFEPGTGPATAALDPSLSATFPQTGQSCPRSQ